MARQYPNIIITGTPGTGKTVTASTLLDVSKSSSPALPLKILDVNAIAKTNDFYDSYDEELQTHVVDEDKLLDHIEETIADGAGPGGFVIDWHVCDIFPERWIDLVVVLRCDDTTVFYERLAGKLEADGDGADMASVGRGYTGKKLQENIDAEIFGTIADEAKEAWPGDGQVVELRSVQVHEIEDNCERILQWCQQWIKDQEKRNG